VEKIADLEEKSMQDHPSELVIARRVRNRIMQVLDLASSFDAQLGYQHAVPRVFVPHEVIHQWDDWVQAPPARALYNPDVFSDDEVKAMADFHAVFLDVCEKTPAVLPALGELQELPEWRRLAHAAGEAARVFLRRGQLSEDE